FHGLGGISDPARGFLGNPSGGRADRARAGDRASAPGLATAQTLRLGRRKGRRRGSGQREVRATAGRIDFYLSGRTSSRSRVWTSGTGNSLRRSPARDR